MAPSELVSGVLHPPRDAGGRRATLARDHPAWPGPPLSRRQFGKIVGTFLASGVAGTGCHAVSDSVLARQARLTARPSARTTAYAAGTRGLGLGGPRDAVLHLPAEVAGPLPLLVLLHGAGGSGAGFLGHLAAATDSLHAAILAPDSQGQTWDALRAEQRTLLDVITSRRRFAGFGPDVSFLDRALERVFGAVAIDPGRIAVAGFSDGATYALSLGLINGDLFRRIVAFSPGFVIEGERHGRPDVFVSHGRADEILPIDRCSRRIVPQLQGLGYSTTFREFEGGHAVPEDIAREAMTWALASVFTAAFGSKTMV